MAKKLHLGFSLEQSLNADLLVLPIPEPSKVSFQNTIEAELKNIWEDNAYVHLHEWRRVKTANDEGRVLWGYSEYRTTMENRLSWTAWDKFLKTHFGKACHSPERPPTVSATAIMAEAKYLLDRKLFILEGILIKFGAPVPKKTARKPRVKRKGEQEAEIGEDEDDERWSYSALLVLGE